MTTKHLIVTRYIGPTDRRGSRIVARLGTDSRKRVMVAYDHTRSVGDNHWKAARTLASKLGFANVGYDEISVGARELGFVVW